MRTANVETKILRFCVLSFKVLLVLHCSFCLLIFDVMRSMTMTVVMMAKVVAVMVGSCLLSSMLMSNRRELWKEAVVGQFSNLILHPGFWVVAACPAQWMVSHFVCALPGAQAFQIQPRVP